VDRPPQRSIVLPRRNEARELRLPPGGDRGRCDDSRPVRLSAAAFGFRGPDRSYETSAGRAVPVFRADEVRHGAPDGASTSVRIHRRPIAPSNSGRSRLRAGDWVSYEFGLLNDAEVSVAVENDGVVEATIDGAELPALLGAGRHELRVTCSSETAIVTAASIEPVASPTLNGAYALADGN